MKDPISRRGITYSALPVSTLKAFAAGVNPQGDPLGTLPNPHVEAGETRDHDFRRRYAAILLRERGL